MGGVGVAAGRTMVGARFIVHSDGEGAAKPRPYPRPPCGGLVTPQPLPPAAGSESPPYP